MPVLTPDEWLPVGVEELEDSAMAAIRWPGSSIITAGPGAGKTEFLAQRAVYLLQTGVCPAPCRVLAISFKRDSARNLRERVRARCGTDLAHRFRSVTFDSFTKNILDRFAGGLPQHWRPANGFSVAYPRRGEFDRYLRRVQFPPALISDGGPKPADGNELEHVSLGTYRLANHGEIDLKNSSAYIASRWWKDNYLDTDKNSLTFGMINRLAELIQRDVAEVRAIIRATYPFVFIDEFQDTSFSQLDLVESLFHRDETVITAVGDGKQRIMTFAGARVDAFERFAKNFSAEPFGLKRNYRSSPTMVAVQQVIANSLDSDSAQAESMVDSRIDSEHAQIWHFASKASESATISKWIAQDMASRGLRPRDYALLVKQKASDFERELKSAFVDQNIRIRNDSRTVGKVVLQDLLSSTLCEILMALLRVMCPGQAPTAYAKICETVLELRGAIDAELAQQQAVTRELDEFVAEWRPRFESMTPSRARAEALVPRLLRFLDSAAVARSFPEYQEAGELDRYGEAFAIHLAASTDGQSSWLGTLDEFEGLESVSLLTIHKSKGLEYDTVILVALDDRTWWSHSKEEPEGTSTIFVAVSRAKQRLMLTYCRARGGIDGVSDLHDLLHSGGVEIVEYED